MRVYNYLYDCILSKHIQSLNIRFVIVQNTIIKILSMSRYKSLAEYLAAECVSCCQKHIVSTLLLALTTY